MSEQEAGRGEQETLIGMRGRREAPPEVVVETFGFDPRNIGRRYRNWWIVTEPSPWGVLEIDAGMLAVSARDGGSNQPDHTVGRHSNFVGSAMDGTYRTYYFRPLDAATPTHEADDE